MKYILIADWAITLGCRCADAILEGYDDVPVRSMVQTIAYREARECLREDRCAAMTAG